MIGCSGDASSAAIDGNESATAEVENPVADSSDVVAQEAPAGSGLQINDYVEKHLQSTVAKNSDEMDYEAGDIYFYSVLDVKGGYAEVNGAFEGVMHFCLWRMDNGNDLFAYSSASCGPVCDYSFEMWECKDGEFGDPVTRQLLPWDDMKKYQNKIWEGVMSRYEVDRGDGCQFDFKLPQKGTSMEVWISVGANDYEFPLLLLSWDKKKFSIKEKYVIPYTD